MLDLPCPISPLLNSAIYHPPVLVSVGRYLPHKPPRPPRKDESIDGVSSSTIDASGWDPKDGSWKPTLPCLALDVPTYTTVETELEREIPRPPEYSESGAGLSVELLGKRVLAPSMRPGSGLLGVEMATGLDSDDCFSSFRNMVRLSSPAEKE